MRRMLAVALSSVLLVPAALAQQPGMGGGRMAPPPDHWLTLDSLAQAVGLTAEQRPKVAAHYDELNAVMKKAADLRVRYRQAMGDSMAQSTEGQRLALQLRLDRMRTEMGGLQQQVDTHYGAIRALLTAAQQAKFDALPKPVVAMRRPTPGS